MAAPYLLFQVESPFPAPDRGSRAGRVCHDPRLAQCQELKEPCDSGFPGFAAGQGPCCRRERRWRAARIVAGCGMAPAAGPLRDVSPLYPVMPELHVETFRATTMIMGRFGQIWPTLTHDHETA